MIELNGRILGRSYLSFRVSGRLNNCIQISKKFCIG